MLRYFAVALLACVLVACGGDVSTQPGSAQSGEREGKSWNELSFVERKGYMANVVLPEMRALFEAYDAERYVNFNCETCHGSDPGARNFEMPSAHLMKLYPTGSPEQKATVSEQREMVTFMYQKVVPTMTRLLDEAPWSDETKTGFGCFNCHTLGESTATVHDMVSDEPGSTAP